jgi:hypothetical protein
VWHQNLAHFDWTIKREENRLSLSSMMTEDTVSLARLQGMTRRPISNFELQPAMDAGDASYQQLTYFRKSCGNSSSTRYIVEIYSCLGHVRVLGHFSKTETIWGLGRKREESQEGVPGSYLPPMTRPRGEWEPHSHSYFLLHCLSFVISSFIIDIRGSLSRR